MTGKRDPTATCDPQLQKKKKNTLYNTYNPNASLTNCVLTLPLTLNTTGPSIISAIQGVPAGIRRQLTKCDGSGKTWGDDGQIRLLARRGERRPGRKTVWLAELSTAAGVAVHAVADPGRPGPSSTAGCSCKNTSQRVSLTTASLAWTFCRHFPLSL